MNYTVFFDVTQAGFRYWWFPCAGIGFVGVGFGLVRFREQLPKTTPKFFPKVFLGFAIFWTVFALLGTVGGYLELSSALRNGRCQVVEGIVSDFHSMPHSGHDKEWFIVGGKRFEYSDYNVTPGFNQTSSHGGPIRKGLNIRVHYQGDSIARLEVANQQAGTVNAEPSIPRGGR
jgi:hypothetical protein